MDTKKNIEVLVKEYKRIFPQEYTAFIEQMKVNLWNSKDEFGEVKGSEYVERKLVEYPETLYTIFIQKLSSEDLVWFSKKEGIRWFVKKFPEFRACEKF